MRFGRRESYRFRSMDSWRMRREGSYYGGCSIWSSEADFRYRRLLKKECKISWLRHISREIALLELTYLRSIVCMKGIQLFCCRCDFHLAWSRAHSLRRPFSTGTAFFYRSKKMTLNTSCGEDEEKLQQGYCRSHDREQTIYTPPVS